MEVEYRMKRFILAGVLALSTGTMSLGAQDPGARRPGPGAVPDAGAMGRGGPRGGPVDNPAEFLLSQTGELRLTDAQLTRLAAIARRSADRRRSLRAQMDSIRPARTTERPDSATRAQLRQRLDQMRPAMERLRDQSQDDRRDAIAVLTPDQQAQAWERVARMGRGGQPGAGRGAGARGRNGLRGGPMPGPGMRGRGIGPRRMGPPADDAGPRNPGERLGWVLDRARETRALSNSQSYR